MKARLLLLLVLLPLLAFGQTSQSHSYKRRASTLSVKTQSNQGLFMWLTDGSAWEIRHSDRNRSSLWTAGKKVIVYITNDADYPYRIQYDPTGEVTDIVSARYLKRL